MGDKVDDGDGGLMSICGGIEMGEGVILVQSWVTQRDFNKAIRRQRQMCIKRQAQAGLELLELSNPPTSASKGAGTTAAAS